MERGRRGETLNKNYKYVIIYVPHMMASPSRLKLKEKDQPLCINRIPSLITLGRGERVWMNNPVKSIHAPLPCLSIEIVINVEHLNMHKTMCNMKVQYHLL